MPLNVVTAAEMRAIEQAAAARGLAWPVLMESAALAVAEAARPYLAAPGARALALVGPGNNGGDGLAALRRLALWGVPCCAYLWRRAPEGDVQCDLAAWAGVKLLRAEDDPDQARLRLELRRAAVVLDALLGTGRRRPIEGLLAQVLATLAAERAGRVLLAVDLPSGLDADSGALDPATVPADLTVTFAQPKRGLLLYPGAAACGRLIVADIGIPAAAAAAVAAEVWLPQELGAALPPRRDDAHKGTFGRVLVIGGAPTYFGAPRLAGRAAARIGAGLVTLAAPAGIVPALAGGYDELTYLPLPAEPSGALGPAALGPLRDALPVYAAVVLGPGLGRAPETVELVRRLLAPGVLALPAVIDADALNALAADADWSTAVGGQLILTPHPAEMARLRGGLPVAEAERLDVARMCAARWGQVVVLKGAHTVVAEARGRAVVCPWATPALATAGSGDVLAGAIAGLLAQGLAPFVAAVLGVHLHALAGRLLERRYGRAGAVASDQPDMLPAAWTALAHTALRDPFDIEALACRAAADAR